MNNLTQQDYQNILALISKTPITGEQSTTVAILMQKITALLQPIQPAPEKPVEEKKEEKK